MQFKVRTRWINGGSERTDEQLYWRREQAVSHYDRMKGLDSVKAIEILNPDGRRIMGIGNV